MRGAKSVIDKEVAQAAQVLRKRRVVALVVGLEFFVVRVHLGREAHVLQQHDLAVMQIAGSLFEGRTLHVVHFPNFFPQQFFQPFRYHVHFEFRVGAFGAAEVAHQDNLAPCLIR